MTLPGYKDGEESITVDLPASLVKKLREELADQKDDGYPQVARGSAWATTLLMEVAQALPRIGDPARCKSCQARIFWTVTRNDKRMPLDGDGVPHWATCPHAEQHRKPRAKA